MEMTGARILMECLKREGVELLFGYPGGQAIDLYHELTNHPELRHILVRHEQGAAHADALKEHPEIAYTLVRTEQNAGHMASGYARISGKVGVCMVTSGPGATNLITGIATAYMDSIPMVAITGQVPTYLIGNDAFQEADIVGITRPCTKHNFLVKDIAQLATVLRQAFHLARSGRPGPVLVDIPKDVQIARTEFVWPEEVRMRSYNPTYRPNLNQLRRAADLILAAERPLFIAGGGVISSNASEILATLARELSIPVTTTLMVSSSCQ